MKYVKNKVILEEKTKYLSNECTFFSCVHACLFVHFIPVNLVSDDITFYQNNNLKNLHILICTISNVSFSKIRIIFVIDKHIYFILSWFSLKFIFTFEIFYPLENATRKQRMQTQMVCIRCFRVLLLQVQDHLKTIH